MHKTDVRLKKLLPLILSLIIIYNSIGSFIAFKVIELGIKQDVKKTIKQGLPIQQYTLIKLTEKDIDNKVGDFKFYNDDAEFRYYDCMFDVVSKKIINDTIYFYCLNDEKEDILFEQLDVLVKNNIESNLPFKKQNEVVSQLIIKGIFPENTNELSIISDNIFKFRLLDESLKVVYFDILTPPPKQLV